MSKETFEPRQTFDEPAPLEPVDNRPEYQVPPEFHRAEVQHEYTEVKSRLEPLREAIQNFERQRMPIPGNLTDAYNRLAARQKKLEQQLGLGKQTELFSATPEAEQMPSSRAA